MVTEEICMGESRQGAQECKATRQSEDHHTKPRKMYKCQSGQFEGIISGYWKWVALEKEGDKRFC